MFLQNTWNWMWCASRVNFRPNTFSFMYLNMPNYAGIFLSQWFWNESNLEVKHHFLQGNRSIRLRRWVGRHPTSSAPSCMGTDSNTVILNSRPWWNETMRAFASLVHYRYGWDLGLQFFFLLLPWCAVKRNLVQKPQWSKFDLHWAGPI